MPEPTKIRELQDVILRLEAARDALRAALVSIKTGPQSVAYMREVARKALEHDAS
jgi:hypothetical protein